MQSNDHLYDGVDPRDFPAYTAQEAGDLLGIPGATVRTWANGTSGRQAILSHTSSGRGLSFNNLVEIYVLGVLRRQRAVPLARVRDALVALSKKFDVERPLLTQELFTDNGHIFIEHMGHYLDVSERNQMAMREVLAGRLDRIERDERNLAARFFPITRQGRYEDVPRRIIVDPRISWGRPCFTGTNVPVEEVVARFNLGEPMAELAEDFGLEQGDVEEAIRLYNMRPKAA